MLSYKFSRTLIAVFVLLFFSVATVVWFYIGGAQSSYVISPEEFQFRYVDDTPMGGDTQGRVYTSEIGDVVLECVLGSAYRWSFCEVAISLSPSVTRGIDLGNYHSMIIESGYKAPAPDERLRVYLRNFNEAYSTKEDPVSMKFNGIEYNPTEEVSEIVLPLNSFQVLSWWISDLDVPLEHAGPDMSNISLIEIATGSAPILGKHELIIKSVRFEGMMVTEAGLFRSLTFIWLFTATILLAVKYVQSRRVYDLERRRANRLKAINTALKQQSETLSIMATTDALTGLRNRMDIYRELEKALASTNGQDCTALCLDIDHFKKINDTYGHDMGDRLLKSTAEVLRESVSSSDVIVRWGGEEFVIFCPNRNLAQASFLAEKIRFAFETMDWPHQADLTCSVGVSSMREGSIAAMIADADDALYRAKQSGRNRVEVFAESFIAAV
ncbi:GGDEF domain-containing protein [Grimontia sp. NTOU-MAR1]|uniref:GGDEF domain-containing protein n=1 Tax=Grimontia sp. NTOU-MAR1 TaxID=3111011 RepID=UPI002DBC061F|nr:GGDEF domain-containing protein [Grimontia sp. NTOU-MAR1]WRV98317.1 GGDEF domain-containing protein [Grimontia sp. NTOU-MAR1]